jgi:lipopolysaccharide export LptBFGC system permease protein LptF
VEKCNHGFFTFIAAPISSSLGRRSGSILYIVLGFYVFDNVYVQSIQAIHA